MCPSFCPKGWRNCFSSRSADRLNPNFVKEYIASDKIEVGLIGYGLGTTKLADKAIEAIKSKFHTKIP